jgi:putative MFS transporter
VAPVLSAFATELFPTTIRAQASAWIRNGFGNAGSVLGPAIVGFVGASTSLLGSIGFAVSVLALLYLTVVPIVWFAIPETRDLVLDPGG